MSDQTETVYPDVETATRALTSDADYSRAIGQPADAAGNYTEMLPANPLPKEDFGEETFEGKEGIKRAAEEVAARRVPTKDELQAIEPVEVAYRAQYGGKAGETIKPPHEVVTAEQAAFDLQNFREGLRAQEQAAVDELLRQQVDGERGVQTTEALGAEPQSQPTPDQPQATADDDEVARALQNPKVLAAVQDHVNQATAQAQQARAAYEQALQSAYQTEVASGLAGFPEFNGMNVQQAQGALHLLKQQNPQRFLEVQGHLQRLGAIQQQWAQAQQARQAEAAQQWQQGWQQFRTASDNAYENWVSKEVPSATERAAIEAEAKEMMLEACGGNAQQLAQAWNFNDTIRSAEGQALIFQAARGRLARKGIRDKRDRTPPTVQHPGAGFAEIASREDYGLRALSEKVSRTTGRDQIRAAAELVAARRARR